MEKNIYIFPTDQPSRLGLNKNNQLELHSNTLTKNLPYFNPQDIYITSDEEIKDSDWCYHPILRGGSVIKTPFNEPNSTMKKIILTTDPELIADGVQAIDDEFLEWLIKNPTCEFVETLKDKCLDTSLMCDCVDEPCKNKGYKIIMPQEEPKQDYNEFKLDEPNKQQVKTTPHHSIVIGDFIKATKPYQLLVDNNGIKIDKIMTLEEYELLSKVLKSIMDNKNF